MGARKSESLRPKLPYPAGFPRNEESFKWIKGELSVVTLTPSVMYGTARGVMTPEVGVFLCGYLSRYVAQRAPNTPPLRLFSDDRLVERADTAYRDMMGNWVREHKDHIVEVNLLTSSRLFAMAIAVGRLVVGGVLDTYHDVRAFEDALAEAVRAHQRS